MCFYTKPKVLIFIQSSIRCNFVNNLLWSVMLTRAMSFPSVGLTTSRPSMRSQRPPMPIMPTRIHAYLAPPNLSTPGNRSRSHTIHTWYSTRGRMSTPKICLLLANLKPCIRRAEAWSIFFCRTSGAPVPFYSRALIPCLENVDLPICTGH